MTNLTKQEIQDARELLKSFTTTATLCSKDLMVGLVAKKNNIVKTLEQALDIAEKQVWLPISEAPKDGTEILVCFPKGAIHVVRWGETHREDVSECWVFTDTTDSCSFEFEEATHYMPLPTPPHV